MTLYLLFFFLFLATILGAPLFVIIVSIAMLGFYTAGIDLSNVAIELYRIANTPMLLALPLFTLAGYVLGESRTSARLVRLTYAFLGWAPNGLAIVAFTACAFFTAFTGATGVTIVALGALLYPALTENGYSEKFSLGLITTSGSLGILLPPSLPLIIYGIIAGQMNVGPAVEIKDLFYAGVFPGLLMVAALSGWSFVANRNRRIPTTRFSAREALGAVREAVWEIPLPFFVLGGIYSGYFAVSETAAVTALYVLIVEVFVYKEIPIKKVPDIMRRSMILVGGILLILGVSMASTNYLIDVEAPMKLFELIQAHVSSKLMFLLLLNILLLVVGSILDIFSALIIMAPLIIPVAASYGVHPVHLGIIFLANMQIGYSTPPVGMALFIASLKFQKPVVELYSAAIPYIIILFAAVLVITYWPWLSLFLISN